MLFGERPIDPRELVDALVQGVVPKIEKNEPWTKAVMDVLRELGKKKGHYVTPDPSVDQREYMLDLLRNTCSLSSSTRTKGYTVTTTRYQRTAR
jgi:hypothetical protein